MSIKGVTMLVRICRRFWVSIVTIGTPIFWCWIFFLDGSSPPSHAMRCLYILAIMATYWMTSVFPLAITSLIPVALFPLLGILSTKTVAMQYLNNATMMFLGGLILAIGVETSGLHKRIALKMMLIIGTSPRRVMLSCMLATAFLSMWISNTATTAMMLPIVEAVCESLPRNPNDTDEDRRKRKNLLLLSIAYAANIGGTGVITGSPPNLLVLKELPEAAGVNFATWMGFCIPLMVVNLFICWMWLTFVGMRLFGPGRKILSKENDQNSKDCNDGYTNYAMEDDSKENRNVTNSSSEGNDNVISLRELNKNKHGENVHLENATDKTTNTKSVYNVIKEQYINLGSMRLDEFFMLVCFVILVCLWFFQRPRFIPGWADVIESEDMGGEMVKIGAATPAFVMVLIVFTLPKKNPFKSLSNQQPAPGILTWEVIQHKLQWGVIILLGGGFALSKGVKDSGLSTWLVKQLQQLQVLDVWVINLIICLLTASITEVVSNTATANILVPILKQMSATLCSNPVYLVLSSVVTCSYAFMLPVATAPNAIVYSASSMSTRDMASMGFAMNIICVFMTTIAINTYGVLMFDLNTFPEWATEIIPSNLNLTCSTNNLTIT